MKRILITPGDPDGIGLEVTIKALRSLGPQRKVQFSVWCHHSQLDKISQLRRRTDVEWIVTDELAPIWVEESTEICLKGQADALVTGPLSKTLIKQSGLKDIGHSEIFRRLSRVDQTFMLFVGSKARILLLTDHVPLKSVPKGVTPTKVIQALKLFNQFNLRTSPPSWRRAPFALLGINPHAGESGLIGTEDRSILERAIKMAQKRGIKVTGPYPADGFFAAQMHLRHPNIVASYHDQGLIPFKMLHGFNEGVHVTLGLPFIRTSVDHGTGKDIYGKGVAHPGSMRDAISLAIKVTGRGRLNLRRII